MKMIKFLGQNIYVGCLVGDMCYYNTCLCYDDSPTYFNPFEYMRTHGGIPDSDHEYAFYNPDTGDNYPVFSFTLIHDDLVGGKLRVGYKFRTWNGASWDPWPVTSPVVYHWSDGYEGADPENITEEDGWRNGLYIVTVTVASEHQPYQVGEWGIVLGHQDLWHDTPTGAPRVEGYEYNEDYEPYPRYIPESFEFCYNMFDTSSQQTAIPNLGSEWMELLYTNIADAKDDTSGPAGGGGLYDFSSDVVPFPSLPSLNIMDSGIATMWSPTTSQMQSFVDFLWSDDFYDNVIKLCADPLDNVIQFGIVPFDLSSHRDTAKEVCIGNVSSGVTMSPLDNQYVEYDMGALSIREAFGNCLDYNNTKVSIFLPYVGIFDLTPDEVMNTDSIAIHYSIDLLSGDFMAHIQIQKKMPLGKPLNAIMYHRSGNLMIKLPLTGANYGRVYQSMITGAAQAFGSALTGNFGGAAAAAAGMVLDANSQPTERSGSYTGNSASLGCEFPYLILTQPVQVMPKEYGDYEGYPAYIMYTLSELDGYTKVNSVIDNTVGSATDTEREEIERLLKEGVYLVYE